MNQGKTVSGTNRMFGRVSWQRRLLLAVLILLVVGVALAMQPLLPARIGKLDFTAYWSTSYLLAHGNDYTDVKALDRVERELTGWSNEFTLKLWNLPWVVVWFIPFSFLGFEHAASAWLMINLLLLFLSIAFYWRANATHASTHSWFWLPMLAAALFPSTILLLLFGQVGLLVLAGLIGFMVLYQSDHDLSAGICLALTTVKPHLVFVTLPLLFLVILKSRRLRVFAGFGLLLLASLLIGLLFRPSLLSDYLAQSAGSDLYAWQNPTLAAYAHVKTGQYAFRLVGVLILPAAIAFWYRYGQNAALYDLVIMTLLVSLVSAPFGWSYDFVLLLLPIVQIMLWAVEGRIHRLETIALAVIALIFYLVIFRQRITSQNELNFFWIPLLVGSLYLWARFRRRKAPITLVT